MTNTDLPEALPCPKAWKYTEKWKDEYQEKNGYRFLGNVCEHSEADFKILYHICEMGEVALTKIKTQNLYIKRLASGSIDVTKIGGHDIDWQSGHTWVALLHSCEELFDVYNAEQAPDEILALIREVETFMLQGQKHCIALLNFIAETVEQKHQARIALRDSPQRQSVHIDSSEWAAVDERHSAVTSGFIYLLSNPLMPGIYKIGFTSMNPDKRAREISARHRLPASFELIEYWRTKDPYIVEQRIHVALAGHARNGEFFQIDLSAAKEAIANHIIDTAT